MKNKISQKKLLTLLRVARKYIEIKPPGLEILDLQKWGLEISKVLPEFNHWDGQSKENRKAVENGTDLDYQ
jgi:hypothetical protein